VFPSQPSSDERCITIPYFGDRDATIKMGWSARPERIFPRHRTFIMKGSHHFPQMYDAVASAMRSFWDEEIAA
jgi:hypothetical protein